MSQKPFMVGTLEQNTIVVRVGHDPHAPHIGTLTIDDWTVKCAVGRNGLVEAQHKREGDGKTPIGRYPLRYGFYDPDVFGNEPGDFGFPFLPKPANYRWIEDRGSPFYNQLVFETDETQPSRRGERLFDLFIPVGWNDSIPAAAGGSAIFMHAAHPDYSGTAGCVAVAHEELLEMGRRLRPGMMIDIAPFNHEAKPLTPLVPNPPQSMETVTFHGLNPGPKVIVTGAVHGNEPAGPYAISRLIAEFRTGARLLQRGTLTFVPVVNGLAFRKNTRMGDRNLNRDMVERAIPQDNEDRVANVLCPLLRAHDVLIDLHSFSGEGEAFALIGPKDNSGPLEPFAHADAETALVKAMNLPLVVHGWLVGHEKALRQKQAAGVTDLSSLHGVGTTEFMRFAGGYGVTVECGQHLSRDAPQVGYDCVVNGLAHLGMIATPAPEIKLPRVLEITDVILADHDEDRLVRQFKAGDAVAEGEVIGYRADGRKIVAPYDGAVIFTSETARVNTELCYLCKASSRLGQQIEMLEKPMS